MNTIVKPARATDEKSTQVVDDAPAMASGVEGEIRDFIRRDVTPRRLPHVDGDAGTANIGALMERVAGTSIKELDNLIAELTVVRDYLRTEGERVHRELSSYAQVSQAAMASAKIILDSLGQWKTGSGDGPAAGPMRTGTDRH